jgi:peptide deformylase
MAKKLPIVKYGADVLREKAEPVAEVTEELRDLAERMIATMHAAEGVGLAAEQVGRKEAICVLDVPADYDRDKEGLRLNPDVEMPLVLVNPEIVRVSRESESLSEGCLSFPDITGAVRRPKTIDLEYLGLDNQKKAITLTGFYARAAQHEIDHLNGVLFIDHFSHVKKIAVKNKLKRLADKTREA